ncbi:hypothetical protein NDU88_000820 [Pleurodeles waltl]|uniref:Uncharacterized protein n=1 Tax=Pleurodeles waltl TaxID=8319 RepID=A0AAV7WKJ5_PLEWA|nr:hypothetical protein NDU88_000820 [Pleurodeles waltl]
MACRPLYCSNEPQTGLEKCPTGSFLSPAVSVSSGCYSNPIFCPAAEPQERPGRLPNHTCSLERGSGRPRRSALPPPVYASPRGRACAPAPVAVWWNPGDAGILLGARVTDGKTRVEIMEAIEEASCRWLHMYKAYQLDQDNE